jgi:hypothetical protein
VHRLRHPLSSRAGARTGAPITDEARTLVDARIAQRNLTELAALNKFQHSLAASMTAKGVDAFLICLEKISSDLLGTTTSIRSTNAIILPDADGVGWRCIPADEVHERLAALQQYIAIQSYCSPLRVAIVALVMLSCIHPFMDGNGRLSRIVFHAILRQHGAGTEFYVPLKSFYAQSDFGFEIRLRHTFLTSDWTQIALYFCEVLRIHQQQQRADAKH